MGLCCLLESVGKWGLAAIIAVKLGGAVWRIVWPYLVAPYVGQGRLLAAKLRPGDWAVVTGATDGIGKAYAHLLVKLFKAKVVLVGRNASKLADVKKEIEEAVPGAEVACVTFDFANQTSPKDYDGLFKRLRDLQVTCLVNAVGIAYSELAPLEELPSGEAQVTDLLSVNALSPTQLCRLLLPGMKALGRGAVINVSSSSGVFPSPYLSGYAATKRYLAYFSECLGMECAGSGVEVQDVSPFFVATKMSQMRPSFTCPKPEAYAAAALGTFGLGERSFGCLAHALQGELLGLLPHSLVKLLMKRTLADLMAKQRRRKERLAKAQ